MTLSTEHEEIIDDIRDAFNHWTWEEGNINGDAWFAIDDNIAKAIQPNLPDGLRGDAYIGLGDGYPCIILEVGSMIDGKWKDVKYSKDGKPTRVLRVGFDKAPYLLHRRKTELEISFFEYLANWLDTMPS